MNKNVFIVGILVVIRVIECQRNSMENKRKMCTSDRVYITCPLDRGLWYKRLTASDVSRSNPGCGRNYDKELNESMNFHSTQWVKTGGKCFMLVSTKAIYLSENIVNRNFWTSLKESRCNDVYKNRCIVNLRESNCVDQSNSDTYLEFRVTFMCVDLKAFIDSTFEYIENEGASCPALHCMNHILITSLVSPLVIASCCLYIRFQVKKRLVDPPAGENESGPPPISGRPSIPVSNIPLMVVNDPYRQEERYFNPARGRGGPYIIRGRGGLRGRPSSPASWTR